MIVHSGTQIRVDIHMHAHSGAQIRIFVRSGTQKQLHFIRVHKYGFIVHLHLRVRSHHYRLLLATVVCHRKSGGVEDPVCACVRANKRER